MQININDYMQISNAEDPKNISDTTNRNFTTVWLIFKKIISAITTLEKKSTLEVVAYDKETITVRVGGKDRTFNAS